MTDFRRRLADPKAGYALERKGSDRLLVTFGSLLLPADGVPVWNFLRTTEGIDSDRLFVRDHQEQWYQRGIVEHPSVWAMESWLDRVICDYRVVLFAGSSMGGFAALLFGRLLAVDVYTINPQTSLPLDRTLGHEPAWNIQLDKVLLDPPEDAVLDVAGAYACGTKTVVVYAAQNPVDVRHAERMIDATLVPREFDNHLLVRHMTQTGEITKVLSGRQPLP